MNKTRRGGGCLLSLSIAGAAIAVAFGFIFMVDRLPFTFGELLALLGVGMVMGALMGQNKRREVSLREYLNQRSAAFATCYILLCGIGLAYQVKFQDPLNTWTVIGIMVIPVTGGVAGFLVGKDK